MAWPSNTTVIDSFDRADGDAGANWTADPFFNNDPQLQIVSNAAWVGASDFACSWWNAAQYGRDAEVFVTVSVVYAQYVRLGLRITSPSHTAATADGYFVHFYPNGLDYYRIDNNVATELGSFEAFTSISAGDVLGVGMVASRIQAYINGVATGTGRTDTTYESAGYFTLFMYDPTTRAGRLNDFGGGTVLAPSLRVLSSPLRW
jgi:hypothetical protein